MPCTTRPFFFSRCKRGQFHSNLLVSNLACDRATHSIALRWNQEEFCYPFVVFPAFGGRILKTVTRKSGNLRVGLPSELSFEHFIGGGTSSSNESYEVEYSILALLNNNTGDNSFPFC